MLVPYGASSLLPQRVRSLTALDTIFLAVSIFPSLVYNTYIMRARIFDCYWPPKRMRFIVDNLVNDVHVHRLAEYLSISRLNEEILVFVVHFLEPDGVVMVGLVHWMFFAGLAHNFRIAPLKQLPSFQADQLHLRILVIDAAPHLPTNEPALKLCSADKIMHPLDAALNSCIITA